MLNFKYLIQKKGRSFPSTVSPIPNPSGPVPSTLNNHFLLVVSKSLLGKWVGNHQIFNHHFHPFEKPGCLGFQVLPSLKLTVCP